MTSVCNGGLKLLRVLGLETSCDDTAAAVVEATGAINCAPRHGRILSQATFGQVPLHAPYGGVVPEIAARAHAERADIAIEVALKDAGLALRDMDAIAVTAGPGLAPGLLAGVMTARGVAAASGIPVYPVNHLEAHALTPRLSAGLDFPYLTLLASGGHCLFASTEGPLRHTVLGATRDDAPGEAFDKVARLLGLQQPGGPHVERLAREGREDRFKFPRPLAGRPGCDLSFSGLKAAVRRASEAISEQSGALDDGVRADLAASFQAALRDSIVERARSAMERFRAAHLGLEAFVLAGSGGVLANRGLRSALEAACREAGFSAVYPDPELCTDNGAMIAWAAIEHMGAGEPASLSFPVRARWPLDSLKRAYPVNAALHG